MKLNGDKNIDVHKKITKQENENFNYYLSKVNKIPVGKVSENELEVLKEKWKKLFSNFKEKKI